MNVCMFLIKTLLNIIKVKQPVGESNNLLHWNVKKTHLKRVISVLKRYLKKSILLVNTD